MDAAALTLRVPLARAGRRSSAGTRGLAFDVLGGPIVAVCGLTGGAGTSTLAFALADRAARESSAPVLLTEADPQHASLAALTGRHTPLPLATLATRVDDRQVPRDTFAELSSGLRLIAAVPQPAQPVDHDAVIRLFVEARAAHGLVVVDCSTSWTADSAVLARATHIIWTLPATHSALFRASWLLDAVAPPPGRWREALAATRVTPVRTASVRALRRLARRRCEQLMLIGHDEALAQDGQIGDTTYDRALTGLAALLRRDP